MNLFTRRRMFGSVGAASIAAISIAKSAPATQPMDETTDRIAIIETANKIGILSDRRDWEAVKNCFADQVEFDYTSLNGGEPATVSAAIQVQQWADFFSSTFKNTQHLIGSHVVMLSGNTASAIAHFQAHHTYLDVNQSSWLLAVLTITNSSV
ncbi:MAG: nuclear transport factor 2 family protein [Leptolyngbyaceae cyanobacterium SM1_3_5]|nr:nuclear transport factor 2 family protein [Leptolyngbyaceae cyanobacterium SM1_3_5]